jgi:hypothetical protein
MHLLERSGTVDHDQLVSYVIPKAYYYDQAGVPVLVLYVLDCGGMAVLLVERLTG